MKSKFLLKWWIALCALLSLSIGANAQTATHSPGVYETATASGGYGQTLTTYPATTGKQYEIYSFVGYQTGFTAGGKSGGYTAYQTVTNSGKTIDAGWFVTLHNGGSSTAVAMPTTAAQFTGATSQTVNYRATQTLTIKVIGYDEFAFVGRDNSTGTDECKFFTVTVNGTPQTMTKAQTSTIRSFALDPSITSTIVVQGGNATTCTSNNVFQAFSLRVAETTPALSFTGTLNAFSTTTGTPSASQSFSVAGSNLTGTTVTVTAPTGYEISTTAGGTYASSLPLTVASNAVSSTLYIRLTGASAGTPAGNITASDGTTSATPLSVSGTVTAPKTQIAIPTAVTGLTYTSSAQTGVAAGIGYALSDASATNAGNYTATATLTDTSTTEWADGTTGAKQISWSIAKATGSGSVTIADYAAGTTPATPAPESTTNGIGSVSYSYAGAGGTTYSNVNPPTAAGTYRITATFAATVNYEAVQATFDFTVTSSSVPLTAPTGLDAEATQDGAVITWDAVPVACDGYVLHVALPTTIMTDGEGTIVAGNTLKFSTHQTQGSTTSNALSQGTDAYGYTDVLRITSGSGWVPVTLDQIKLTAGQEVKILWHPSQTSNTLKYRFNVTTKGSSQSLDSTAPYDPFDYWVVINTTNSVEDPAGFYTYTYTATGSEPELTSIVVMGLAVSGYVDVYDITLDATATGGGSGGSTPTEITTYPEVAGVSPIEIPVSAVVINEDGKVTFTVEGLESYTTYNYWVEAVCGAESESTDIEAAAPTFTTGFADCEKPTITAPSAADQILCGTAVTALSIDPSANLTKVEWYQVAASATSNTGGTLVFTKSDVTVTEEGDSDSNYTPTLSDTGYKYYAVATNDFGGCVATTTASTLSGEIRQKVATTAFTTSPASVAYETGNTAAQLTAVADGDATVTYTWYQASSTTANPATDTNLGATAPTPSTATVATYYYYATATNGCGSPITSGVAVITVTEALAVLEAPIVDVETTVTTANLSWQPQADASYKVEVCKEGAESEGPTTIATLASFTNTVTGGGRFSWEGTTLIKSAGGGAILKTNNLGDLNGATVKIDFEQTSSTNNGAVKLNNENANNDNRIIALNDATNIRQQLSYTITPSTTGYNSTSNYIALRFESNHSCKVYSVTITKPCTEDCGSDPVCISSDPSAENYSADIEVNAGNTAIVTGLDSNTDYTFTVTATRGEEGTLPSTPQTEATQPALSKYTVKWTDGLINYPATNKLTNGTIAINDVPTTGSTEYLETYFTLNDNPADEEALEDYTVWLNDTQLGLGTDIYGKPSTYFNYGNALFSGVVTVRNGAGEITETYNLSVKETRGAPTGIDEATREEQSVEYYTLTGVKLAKPAAGVGVIIKKIRYTDGSVDVVKTIQ